MKRFFLFFKQFFNVSYREARGLAALFVVSLIALFLLFFPEVPIQDSVATDPAEAQKLDSLEALLRPATQKIYFPFDPNTISRDSILLMGIPEYVANRIINYREKGGRFKVKDDLRKIYGISSNLVDSLYPWIGLPEIMESSTVSASGTLDINIATKEQLKKLKLIGDVLAARILKYRDLLGGFVTKDQYSEVYGLSDEAMAHLTNATIVQRDFKPRLIRINHSDFEALVRHPYISRELASDILKYREVKSTIESEKVLAVFNSVDKTNFKKLILYLDFQ